MAPRLAQGAKNKLKNAKKLNKSDSKTSEEKKVVKTAVTKLFKKKKTNKIEKSIPASKKELIKNSLAGKDKNKVVNVVEEIPVKVSKVKDRVVKKKVANSTKSVATTTNVNSKQKLKKKKKLGKIKVESPVLPKMNEKEARKKKSVTKTVKKLSVVKKKVANSTKSVATTTNVNSKQKLKKKEKLGKIKVESPVLPKMNEKEARKKKSVTKTVKKLSVVKNSEKNVDAANNKNTSTKVSSGLTKQHKKQISKSTASKKNKNINKKSQDLQISVPAKKDKSTKKLKLNSEKLIESEKNEEVKIMKSKKRKLSDTPKEEKKVRDKPPSKAKILNYVQGFLKYISNEEKNKKLLLELEKPPVFLQVTCIKVPKAPLHQMRILLPHSMVQLTDDVALFVSDLKRGRRSDYEPTVRHYEDLLREKGCTGIKAVIPMNQVKTEYRQFEMRRKLLGSYDYFLIDGRISGHMAHLLGKTFKAKRKLPVSIHIEKKDLKAEIDTALRKTSLEIHSNGDSSIVQIGKCSMSAEKLTDNILAVVEKLSKDYPGGWKNIRSLRIKTPTSLAIPIYITLKSKNNVSVPVQQPKRPKAYKEVRGELSTLTGNVEVIVAPDGAVAVQRLSNDSDTEEDTSEVKEKPPKKLKSDKENEDESESD